MARDWTNEDMPTAPDSRDSVELLPCPFCGSDQVSLSEGETGDGQPWPYVECESCAATAMPDNWNNRQALARGPQQAGGEDGWVAVADRLPTLDEWPIGTIRTALTFHPMRGIRTETMRPEHWNHIDRRGPGYHGPEVTHWRFPPPPPAAIDAAIGGTGDA